MEVLFEGYRYLLCSDNTVVYDNVIVHHQLIDGFANDFESIIDCGFTNVYYLPLIVLSDEQKSLLTVVNEDYYADDFKFYECLAKQVVYSKYGLPKNYELDIEPFIDDEYSLVELVINTTLAKQCILTKHSFKGVSFSFNVQELSKTVLFNNELNLLVNQNLRMYA